MKNIVSYSFRLNKNVLKVIGLYPSENHQTLYKIFAYIVYILATTPQTVFGAVHVYLVKDFRSINYQDFLLIAMIFYSFKLFPFVMNGNKIKLCIQFFDSYIFTKKEDQRVVQECITECQRNSKIYFGGCVAAYIGFVGQLIFLEDFQQLPMNIWAPKYIRASPKLYFILYFLAITGILYIVLACGVVDPLVSGLCHHATVQLKILKHKLQHLEDFSENNRKHLYISDKIYLEIITCVKQYKAISLFVKEYQSCFSPVVFIQFLGSGIIIGLCCFQMTKMVAVDINFLLMLNYLVLLFFQIFFYCYYGTLLHQESDTFPEAIYLSEWYMYNSKCKKALLILMEVSSKPMVVKAGKLFDLSLETFSVILKRSYSLLAILKN